MCSLGKDGGEDKGFGNQVKIYKGCFDKNQMAKKVIQKKKAVAEEMAYVFEVEGGPEGPGIEGLVALIEGLAVKRTGGEALDIVELDHSKRLYSLSSGLDESLQTFARAVGDDRLSHLGDGTNTRAQIFVFQQAANIFSGVIDKHLAAKEDWNYASGKIPLTRLKRLGGYDWNARPVDLIYLQELKIHRNVLEGEEAMQAIYGQPIGFIDLSL